MGSRLRRAWAAAAEIAQKTALSLEDVQSGLAIDVGGRIRSPRMIEVLSRLVSERGAPSFLREGALVLDRRARNRYGVDRARHPGRMASPPALVCSVRS